MQIHIAGYNIDKALIDRLDPNIATPESISAAYARISRSSKSVTELRQESLGRIETARTSNESIIFGMGHSSVAEHAVFNIDLIGISRYLTESVQAGRLASFTEKSQRYVTFSRDYITPVELDTPDYAHLKGKYWDLMDALFTEYETSYQLLVAYYEAQGTDLPRRELEGKAKEDARYILPLSTKTQMGMTINARSLESLLRRLYQSELREARELYDKLLSPISRISPSLVKYTTGGDLPACISYPDACQETKPLSSQEQVRLVSSAAQNELVILAAMMYEKLSCDYDDCLSRIKTLSSEQVKSLWDELFLEIEPWHKMPRAFELIDTTMQISMSEACWGQFKRHRMSTMIKHSGHTPGASIIPQAIHLINRTEAWELQIEQARSLEAEFMRLSPTLSPYLRLNASPVSVLCKMNLREIYHFVRLRSDQHAQWEIRLISDQIARLLRDKYPNATRYLAGKSEFAQIH